MATAKIEEREAIVLSRIPQKERDAMVRCLGKDGFFSFYAHGAFKMGSPTASSGQELARSAFLLTVSGSGALTLKEGRIRHLYAPAGGLEGMLVAQLLLEYCLKAVNPEDGPALYPLLEASLEALEQNADPYSVAIMFLSRAAKIGGYGLEVERCVVCGERRPIGSLSLVQGGFVCTECMGPVEALPTPKGELRILYHSFLCPLEDLRRVTYPKEDVPGVLRALLTHVEEQSGVRLKALSPIFRA
ncbi:MAG: DNA repair protein RecO [Bacilli bacterium]|nr:DNA repair protein RecO [Bacilli bacterium]